MVASEPRHSSAPRRKSIGTQIDETTGREQPPRSTRMRLAALSGRSCLVGQSSFLDVETASRGRFGPDPMNAFSDWSAFRDWASDQNPTTGDPYQSAHLTCPVPSPSQIFAIGLNYRAHADESAMDIPEQPMAFTKFPSALSGPCDDIPLVPGSCDWEVELVLVIASTGRNFKDIDVEGCVAGLTVGQDLSERDRQLAGTNAQFNLAKSHRGFAPIGPEVVTLDEFDNPWDLEIRCEWNGVTVQHARTSQLIHDIPSLIVYLSSICELRAGDLVFTGTPSGVGFARTPPEYLEPGDVLTSTIQGIGTLENRCQ